MCQSVYCERFLLSALGGAWFARLRATEKFFEQDDGQMFPFTRYAKIICVWNSDLMPQYSQCYCRQAYNSTAISVAWWRPSDVRFDALTSIDFYARSVCWIKMFFLELRVALSASTSRGWSRSVGLILSPSTELLAMWKLIYFYARNPHHVGLVEAVTASRRWWRFTGILDTLRMTAGRSFNLKQTSAYIAARGLNCAVFKASWCKELALRASNEKVMEND